MSRKDFKTVQTFKCLLSSNAKFLHIMSELSYTINKNYYTYILTDHNQVLRCQYRKIEKHCICEPIVNHQKIEAIKICKNYI